MSYIFLRILILDSLKRNLDNKYLGDIPKKLNKFTNFEIDINLQSNSDTKPDDLVTGGSSIENTLSEDDHAKELQQYGKQLAIELLRDDMTKYTSFYKFMKSYSPKDYKYTNRKEYVSQRVIAKHVELWNEIHTKKLRTLRIFFL